MRLWTPALPLLLLSAAVAQPAETLTPEAALTRLLSAAAPRAEWFAPEFLAQAPLDLVAAQLAGIRQAYGAFLRLDTLQGRPLAVYERGTLLVTAAAVDDQGRLSTFGAVPGPAPQATGPATPGAAVETVTQVLTRVFQPDTVDAALFAPSFLAAVPAAQLQADVAAMRAEFGPFVRVDLTGTRPQVVFERGALTVGALQLDEQGRITALQVAPAAPDVTFGTLDEAMAAFQALPGDVSVLVQDVSTGQAVAALHPERFLAVGLAIERGRRGNDLASVAELPDSGAAARPAECEDTNRLSGRGSAEGK